VIATGALGSALLLGARHFSEGRAALCAGADAHLAGIWERTPGTPRREAIRRIFESKSKTNAAQLFAGVSGLLDTFVDHWAAMYRETCEATRVHGEQSSEVLDLRMACLGQRLAGIKALTDVFAMADASVIDNAASAAGSLPNLEACSDIEMLRSIVQPPSDQKMRDKVTAVRAEIANARALVDAGQCTPATVAGAAALAEAKAVGYAPLEAEAYYVVGRAGNFCGDASAAVDAFEAAIFSAEASHHDEIAAEAAICVGGIFADRLRDTKAGRRWLRYSDALLTRMPGHPKLEAFALQSWGIVEQAEGKLSESVRDGQRALALKEQALGPLHPDTAISAMNLGNVLHDLGRDAEAEPYAARAVSTFDRLLGPESTAGATALLDHGEVLTTLGRYEDARHELERAVSIWTKAGANPFFVAYARLDLARLELAEKRPKEARRFVEDAVDVIAKQDPQLGAQARFVLAQALWPERRDRERAARLAREARSNLVATSAPAPKVAEVDAWLGSHATP